MGTFKKALILGAASLFAFHGRGQLSLDSAELPHAPDQHIYSIATLGPTVPPLSKDGQGVIWDYNDMDRVGQEIDSFFTVSNTPAAYRTQFDNPFQPEYVADLAYKRPDRASDSIALPVEIEDRYDYFKRRVGAYELLGFGAKINGFPTSTKFQPKDSIYPLPLEFDRKGRSYASFTFDAIPGFYYEQERWRRDTVDGEGKLITPYQVYDPCLRIKTRLTIRDSLKSDSLGVDTAVYRPEKILYEWMAPGEEVPVLRIVERGGVVNRVEYRDTLHNSSLAQNGGDGGLKLHPNPTRSTFFLNIERAKWQKLEIWSFRGEKLKTKKFGDRTTRVRMDLQGLADGVYMVVLKGGNALRRGKVVKDSE